MRTSGEQLGAGGGVDSARDPSPEPSSELAAATAETALTAAHGDAAWVDLCGVRITRLTHTDLLTLVRSRLGDADPAATAIGSVNLDHLHHFGRRRGRPARLTGVADGPHWVLLADGAPIGWRASAASGGPWPRLTGADLLAPMLDVAVESEARVGFLGGTAQSVHALRSRLSRQWPGLRLSGCWTPPRADLLDPRRSRELATVMARTGVDLLVVGLGKPLQESWIDDYGSDTGARVLAAFGGAADFLGETSRRAPHWMQVTGCEWLHRLGTDPRRLSRRYLVQGPPALHALLTDRPGLSPALQRTAITGRAPASRSPGPSRHW